MDIFAKSATGDQMPAVVTRDGAHRLLGRPAEKVPLLRCAPRANPLTLLPESQWVEFDRTQSVVPILDQGQVGSCTGHGGATAVMISRAIEGQSFELLAPGMLYAQVNGGVDQGASLSDVVTALQTTGVCLESQMPDGFYRPSQITSAAKATAGRFQTPLNAWVTFSTFQEMCSLAQMGATIYYSITAGGSWSNDPTSDGVVPYIRGSGNHAQAGGTRMKRLPSGDWAIGGINSWGKQWWLDGVYWFVAKHIDNQDNFEGYALLSTTQDPQDPNLAPVVA
jgi:hypothetical protein